MRAACLSTPASAPARGVAARCHGAAARRAPAAALAKRALAASRSMAFGGAHVASLQRQARFGNDRPSCRAVAGTTPVVAAGGEKKKLAVFVSGGGSNFKAIHAKCLDGTINGEVVLVVSNNPACGGCDYARENDIAVAKYPKGKKEPLGLSPEELVEACKGAGADYVLLAGFLKMIPVELVRAYPGAMLNIHPALLPSFGGPGCYGHFVHEKVVAKGVRYSGPTVHFVDEEYDTGAIIAQRTVPVYPTDTPDDVAARVLKEEHKVFPWVVEALCDGRIELREDGIPKVLQEDGTYL